MFIPSERLAGVVYPWDHLPIVQAHKTLAEFPQRMGLVIGIQSPFSRMYERATAMAATMPTFCQAAGLPVADGLKQIKGNCIRPPAQRQGRNKPQ